MILRRAMYYAQFGAVVVLPVWLLIGRGIIFSSSGWDFVMLLFVAPILAIYLAIIVGLTWARKSVRASKALSWIDVALLAVWYALIIAAGFAASTAVAVLVVVVGVAAFWIQLWQLITETRQRLDNALTRVQRDTTGTSRFDGPEVIRIESRD